MASIGGEEAVADAAVDAFAGLAVVAAQLDKGLAGEGVVALEPGGTEHGDDAVLLGFFSRGKNFSLKKTHFLRIFPHFYVADEWKMVTGVHFVVNLTIERLEIRRA